MTADSAPPFREVLLPSPYRGVEGRPGWTLTGIALMPPGHPPGAKGSAIWEWT